MSNKMFRPSREPLRDDPGHGLELHKEPFLHGRTAELPLVEERAGPRGDSKSFGEGGGFCGRFNFWPSDFLAFSEGLGPRTSGFFMARLPESTPFLSGGEQQSNTQDCSFPFPSENLSG